MPLNSSNENQRAGWFRSPVAPPLIVVVFEDSTVSVEVVEPDEDFFEDFVDEVVVDVVVVGFVGESVCGRTVVGSSGVSSEDPSSAFFQPANTFMFWDTQIVPSTFVAAQRSLYHPVNT
jgi:hypothetical protein